MKKTILYHLRKNNINIEAACNGLWGCGKCKIKLGADFPIVENDETYLSESDLKAGFRLACEHYIDDDEVSHIIALYKKNLESTKNKNNTHILSDSFLPNFTHDKKSDFLGIALDIGTTTLAMSLVDLKTSTVLAKATDTNPQVNYGFDIMSRISYTMQYPNGLKDLQTSLVKTLNLMLDELLKESKQERSYIKEFIVSANTCMCHSLLARDISTLGKYPFIPNFTDTQKLNAPDIGINLALDCKLITLPHISAFVGSDIVSGIYVSELYKHNDTLNNILFIDIGTNGEMVLKTNNKLIASSCAVGPALEGMNISCGMRAENGSIDDFLIANDCIQYTTINNDMPTGICGSGVLALMRELLKNDIINKRGAISKTTTAPFVLTKDGKNYISLSRAKHIIKDSCPKNISNTAKNIDDISSSKRDLEENKLYFSSKDIRQVQLAKAAILSGILCLVKKAELSLDKIDKVYIAGQFGKYISLTSLFGVGLVPKEFEGKIEYLGNTSLSGAYLTLLDSKALSTMKKFSKNVEFFELSKFEDYDKIFTKCLLWE